MFEKEKQLNIQKRRYVTGFDGLRALGVIGVILYHLNPYVFKGGYLGVPIFLVLSGYLITDSFLREWHNNHFLNLKNFFIRRIKRLYPALTVMLFSTCAYIYLFQRNLLHNLKMIVFSNLTYWYNWWQIYHKQSYFNRFSINASPFTHLWTLSIEGQFYLIWPILMLFFLIFIKNRKQIFNLIILLTILSALWMSFLYKPNVDPSRIYYGTFTRMFSILMGCALAFIWHMESLKSSSQSLRLKLDFMGFIGLCGILLLILKMNAEGFFIYHGGMFLFSLFVVMIIMPVAHPVSDWNKWLTNPLFNWIGRRSYGIYIYQFPIMIFFEDKFRNVANHPILYPIIEVIIICIVSELSYQFIEKPISKLDYKKIVSFFKKIIDLHNNKFIMQRVEVIILFFIFAIGFAGIFTSKYESVEAENCSQIVKTLNKENMNNKKHDDKVLKNKSNTYSFNKQFNISLTSSESNKISQLSKNHPVNTSYEKYGLSQKQLQVAQNLSITAVGDSVLLAGSGSLQQIFPRIYIQAKEGRQLSAAIPLFQQIKKDNNLSKIVLICLGTNGPITSEQVSKVMNIIGPNRHVFWLTVHVPTRPWQNSVNRILNSSSKKYKNLTLIHWNTYSSSHPNWFWSDEVHPKEPNGTEEFGAYIAKNILKIN